MSATSSNQKHFTHSGRQSPCLICGRVKDQDCRWKDDLILCHTYVDQDAQVEDYVYRGVTRDGMWGQYFKTDKQKSIRPKSRKEYFYPDRDGNPLIKVVRVDKGDGTKAFYQFHWDGSWVVGLTEEVNRRVPIYRYAEVREAMSQGRSIYVVEGEGCADDLWQLGIPATTTLGGSKKYRSYGDYSQDLTGAQVILCPDRDQVGVEHMEDVVKDYPEARWCYVFPDSPLWKRLPKGRGLDVSDWIKEGATADNIRAAVGEKQHLVSKSDSNVIQLSEFTSTPPSSFEETMERVRQILEIEDEARQTWELGLLAKSVKAFTASQLLNIYKIKEQNTKSFNPIDLHDFQAQGGVEREWLIAAHISTSTTLVLFADGGVGKSLLCYDICKAIATGKPWNGFPVKQGKVLILQTDEPEIDTRERLDIANFTSEIPRDVVRIETNWQFSQIRRLREWVAQERPSFIMIDSFTSANRASEDQEKDATYAASLYDLRDIANEFGCSIMVLHHENKVGGARGTTAIRNNVSEVWRLRKGESKDGLTPTQRVLEIEKSRSGCNGLFKIELNVDDYSWMHQGDFGAEENSSNLPLSSRLLNFLEARRGVRFEPEELTHDFAGTTKEAIRKQLERHRKKGLIKAEDRTKDREGTGAVRYKVYYAPDFGSNQDKNSNQDKKNLEQPKNSVQVCPKNPETYTQSNLDNLDNIPGQTWTDSTLSRFVNPGLPIDNKNDYRLTSASEHSSNQDKNEVVQVLSGFNVQVVQVPSGKGFSDFDSNQDNKKVEPPIFDAVDVKAIAPDESPLKVGDRVLWDSCPGHLSSWSPFTITRIESGAAWLDIYSKPVPISELRRSP